MTETGVMCPIVDMKMETENFVKATLNYTLDNGVAPDYYFYEPDESVKLNPPGTDS